MKLSRRDWQMLLSIGLIVVGLGLLLFAFEAYGEPVQVNTPGVYTFDASSFDTSNPAVTISCTGSADQPVTLFKCIVRFKGGTGIKVSSQHAFVVLDNCLILGTNPQALGADNGTGVQIDSPCTFLMRGCEVRNCARSLVLDDHLDGYPPTIKVFANKFFDQEIRCSDGNEGYEVSQCWGPNVILMNIAGSPNVSISNNLIENEPGYAVGDGINLYQVNGSWDSPVKVWSNCIVGSHPPDQQTPANGSNGIVTDSFAADTPGAALGWTCSYIDINGNTFIGSWLAVWAGYDITAEANTIVNANCWPNGAPIITYACALGAYAPEAAYMGLSNIVKNNVAGGNSYPGLIRVDFCATSGQWSNNQSIPGPITCDTEAVYLGRWKAAQWIAGVRVGLNWSQP